MFIQVLDFFFGIQDNQCHTVGLLYPPVGYFCLKFDFLVFVTRVLGFEVQFFMGYYYSNTTSY